MVRLGYQKWANWSFQAPKLAGSADKWLVISFQGVEGVIHKALTPFPRRGYVCAAVGAVHARGGRRVRPRGRKDPPKGSPGPPERALDVPQRT